MANITLAIATVSLTEPSLAVRRGSSDHLALREVLRDSFETGVFLLVPLAVVVFVWAEPLLNVLFVRGSFDAASLSARPPASGGTSSPCFPAS